MFTYGITCLVAKASAMVCILLVGPTIFPKKINFSSYMFRNDVCIRWEGLERRLKAKSRAVILRLVNISTSAKVGVIGPWPNNKALRVSDKKWEAMMSIDSFLPIFDRESSMHWPMSSSFQKICLEADILQYQLLHLGVMSWSKCLTPIKRIHLWELERNTASFQVNQVCRVWISHRAQTIKSWLVLYGDGDSVPNLLE